MKQTQLKSMIVGWLLQACSSPSSDPARIAHSGRGLSEVRLQLTELRLVRCCPRLSLACFLTPSSSEQGTLSICHVNAVVQSSRKRVQLTVKYHARGGHSNWSCTHICDRGQNGQDRSKLEFFRTHALGTAACQLGRAAVLAQVRNNMRLFSLAIVATHSYRCSY